MGNHDGYLTSRAEMCDGVILGYPLMEVDTGVLHQDDMLDDEEITVCSRASSADESSNDGPGQISAERIAPPQSVVAFQRYQYQPYNQNFDCWHVVCWMLLILTHMILYSMANAKNQAYHIHGTSQSVWQQQRRQSIIKISLCELGSIFPILLIIMSIHHQRRNHPPPRFLHHNSSFSNTAAPPIATLVLKPTTCAIILGTEMIVNAILAKTHSLSVASIMLSSTISGLALSTLSDHYWGRASNRAWNRSDLLWQRQSHSQALVQHECEDNVMDDLDNETIHLLEQSFDLEND